MLTLYLDETGDHSLDKIDPTYPVFVLGGIVIDDFTAHNHLAPLLDQFKRQMFGRTDIVLRAADIRRNRNGFEQLQDEAFRQEFYDGLNELIRLVPFSIVACAIRKPEHVVRYGGSAIDPYMLSLNVLVERFYFEASQRKETGQISAERRGPILDRQLEIAWNSLVVTGTQYVHGARIRSRITGLELRHKQENLAGLQLADLVVSPIGRYVLGKPNHEDWEIIESKFRRHHGRWWGVGLIVLPKE